MADMILATADQIRDELKKLDARRARLRKLLAIAEEDEGTAARPATPPAEADVNAELVAGVREAEARHAATRGETMHTHAGPEPGPGDTGGMDFPIPPEKLPPLTGGPEEEPRKARRARA